MGYYWVRREVSNYEKVGRKYKYIWQNKSSHSEKAKCCGASNYMTHWKRQNYENKKKTIIARG